MSIFTTVFHGAVSVLGGAGMLLGAGLGAIGGGGSALLALVTGGRVKIFPGSFKHTVLSSALGWGSLLAVLSPFVRLHVVGPTINEAAAVIAGSAAIGDKIPAEDVGPAPGGGEIVAVPASYGLLGPEIIHDFALGSVIAEPYNEVTVPSSAYSNGVLTVTNGIAGALKHH